MNNLTLPLLALDSSQSISVRAIDPNKKCHNLLQTLRQQVEAIEVNNYRLAKFLCQAIPASCPFARTICLFGQTIFRIPPLCKLNPFYDQVVSLRFKSLSYLADVCGEDITIYF